MTIAADSKPPVDGSAHPETPRTGLRQYTIAGILFGFVFPVVATAIRILQSGASLSLASIAAAQRDDPLIWIIDTAPLFLGLLAALAGARQDAVAERNRLLIERDQELTSIQANLARRVQQRTKDLEDRNRELRQAVLLTRTLSSIGDNTALVSTTASALASMFAGYEVDIYLLDPSGTVATLAASAPSGTGRWWPLERTVRVGEGQPVGKAASSGKPIVDADGASATGTAATERFALPLIVRGRVLGVLQLQPGPAVSGDHQPRLEIIQLLADQIAAAIESTRLSGETRAALAQLEQLSGQGTQLAWRNFLREGAIAFQYTPAGVEPAREGIDSDDAERLRSSLSVRGQQIGSVWLRRSPGVPWSDAERALADKVAAQVALALENARLLEDTRQRALREQQMSEISTRLSHALDLDTLLQTAVRELAALPGVTDATILLQPSEGTGEGPAP